MEGNSAQISTVSDTLSNIYALQCRGTYMNIALYIQNVFSDQVYNILHITRISSLENLSYWFSRQCPFDILMSQILTTSKYDIYDRRDIVSRKLTSKLLTEDQRCVLRIHRNNINTFIKNLDISVSYLYSIKKTFLDNAKIYKKVSYGEIHNVDIISNILSYLSIAYIYPLMIVSKDWYNAILHMPTPSICIKYDNARDTSKNVCYILLLALRSLENNDIEYDVLCSILKLKLRRRVDPSYHPVTYNIDMFNTYSKYMNTKYSGKILQYTYHSALCIENRYRQLIYSQYLYREDIEAMMYVTSNQDTNLMNIYRKKCVSVIITNNVLNTLLLQDTNIICNTVRYCFLYNVCNIQQVIKRHHQWFSKVFPNLSILGLSNRLSSTRGKILKKAILEDANYSICILDSIIII